MGRRRPSAVGGGWDAGRIHADDEQLLRGRVYGRDHDNPNPGPLPHQTYAALVGGLLDGLFARHHGLATGRGGRRRRPDDRAGAVARRPGAARPAPRRPASVGRPGCGVPLLLLRRHTLTPAGALAYSPALGQLGGGVLDPQQRPLDRPATRVPRYRTGLRRRRGCWRQGRADPSAVSAAWPRPWSGSSRR